MGNVYSRVDSLVWVEKNKLSGELLSQIQKDLLILPKPRRTVAIETVDGVDKKVWRVEDSGSPINTLVETDTEYGMPIYYGCEDRKFSPEDNTTNGSLRWKPSILPKPNHPKAPDTQGKFMSDTFEAVISYDTTLAVAPTGSGKTVVSLYCAGRLGVATLVIVPNSTLADQWAEEAMLHLGLSKEEVGFVGGGKTDWEGKKVVVCIIHNLYMKTYSSEFYEYFGFVVWDEAHRLGAPEFSKTLHQFPAKYKLAMSATPDRKDGLSQILWNYFGKPSVVAQSPALPVTCWEVTNQLVGNLSWMLRCRNDVKPMQWLANLDSRNELLAGIMFKLYTRGYNIIGMSRFIAHVERIGELLLGLGVREEDLGQFTRTKTGKSTRMSSEYLSEMKKRRIILGTYKMLKEGFDKPELDAGVELLPVADNIQGIGRVRRSCEGKKPPVWFSPVDEGLPLFERYAKSRFNGFRKTNVTIKTLNIKTL